MDRKRNLIIAVVSGMFSLFLVAGVYMLQLKQVELQKTVMVVVPKDFVDAGTMLTEEMLALRPIYRSSFEEGMFTELDQVVGLETMMPLGTNEPILEWKLDKYRLLPGEGQATYQIPKEYILSVFSGIRAGDKVIIYISGKEESRRLFPHEITVASVKTSGNVEMDDPENPTLFSRARNDKEKMYASRREANGSIDRIDLNLTEEEWLLIDRLCRNEDNKLVLAFSSKSFFDEGRDLF